MSTQIRPFVAGDAPALVEMAHAFHMESNMRHLQFNRERLLNVFARGLADTHRVLFLVAEEAGQLIGSLYGELVPYYTFDGILATDKWLYIKPGRRGLGAGRQMVRQFEQWARAQGAVEMMISPMTGIATERTVAFLQALGLTPCGVAMKMRL